MDAERERQPRPVPPRERIRTLQERIHRLRLEAERLGEDSLADLETQLDALEEKAAEAERRFTHSPGAGEDAWREICDKLDHSIGEIGKDVESRKTS